MIAEILQGEAVDYKGFQIWNIASFKEFLEGNAEIKEIANAALKLTNERKEQLINKPVKDSIELMQEVLDQIEDQHFLVFEKNDEVYEGLKMMQRSKILDINVNEMDDQHAYVMIMDKDSLKAF
ncbi:hypothetical protein [Brumimicrobium oceani]|uniref:Uncharacterized protein n=1 Tax=Brumimicrobium oceani TaxID=2100725 RepID=A0A2U2XA77_9FLAO|nr:hypothetical protein [Brumimicrobium oceani]PWH84682.1 hypothetical protein DIT68_13235 [Brumimicrobium oceani]